MSADEDILDELFRIVESRRDEQPEGSYTASLLGDDGEVDPVLEKMGEETTELILAAKGDDRDRVIQESADLVYHLLVLLAAKDIPLDDVRAALQDRRG